MTDRGSRTAQESIRLMPGHPVREEMEFFAEMWQSPRGFTPFLDMMRAWANEDGPRDHRIMVSTESFHAGTPWFDAWKKRDDAL